MLLKVYVSFLAGGGNVDVASTQILKESFVLEKMHRETCESTLGSGDMINCKKVNGTN